MQRFSAALLPQLFRNNVPGHITRAPQVGFELATNCIQFYAIANLDKTSLNCGHATFSKITNLHFTMLGTYSLCYTHWHLTVAIQVTAIQAQEQIFYSEEGLIA